MGSSEGYWSCFKVRLIEAMPPGRGRSLAENCRLEELKGAAVLQHISWKHFCLLFFHIWSGTDLADAACVLLFCRAPLESSVLIMAINNSNSKALPVLKPSIRGWIQGMMCGPSKSVIVYPDTGRDICNIEVIVRGFWSIENLYYVYHMYIVILIKCGLFF